MFLGVGNYVLVSSGIRFWILLNFTDKFNNKEVIEELEQRSDLTRKDLRRIKKVKEKYGWL